MPPLPIKCVKYRCAETSFKRVVVFVWAKLTSNIRHESPNESGVQWCKGKCSDKWATSLRMVKIVPSCLFTTAWGWFVDNCRRIPADHFKAWASTDWRRNLVFVVSKSDGANVSVKICNKAIKSWPSSSWNDKSRAYDVSSKHAKLRRHKHAKYVSGDSSLRIVYNPVRSAELAMQMCLFSKGMARLLSVKSAMRRFSGFDSNVTNVSTILYLATSSTLYI